MRTMRSGSQQKGKAVSATQGKTRNQPVAPNFVQKSGTAGPYGNSRTDVHKKFSSAVKKRHD